MMEINFKPAENTDIETLLVLIRELYEVDGSVSCLMLPLLVMPWHNC